MTHHYPFSFEISFVNIFSKSYFKHILQKFFSFVKQNIQKIKSPPFFCVAVW
ncbi:MAG: hypothetical protein RHS_4602 [Robinsoniella sp. RHS]|nr:MAG: hypothetical protein RHS_4602 [Robinsoniella sp. RHS]